MPELDLQYYESLPEAMPQPALENEVLVLIDRLTAQTDRVLFLECLCELAQRQSSNYSLFSKPLLDILNKTIIEVWEKDSLENMESCLFVIIALGLRPAYETFKQLAPEITNKESLAYLHETIDEVDAYVGFVK